MQFPRLYLEKYDDYISSALKEKEIILSDLTFLSVKTKIVYLYEFATTHYCEYFSNLNDHIYYLGELNEHFKNRFSHFTEEYGDLKLENDNLISKSKKKIIFSDNKQNENVKKSDFDYLKEFLSAQMKNHIIHLINVDEKKEDNWQEDFNNLSLYDQENLWNKRNQEVFADRLSKNKSLNGNGDLNSNSNNKNVDNNSPNLHNNSIAIIEGSTIKLTESLSFCQKIILVAGFCASELPQKFDAKVMKSVKNTGMRKRVNYLFIYFYYLKIIKVNFLFEEILFIYLFFYLKINKYHRNHRKPGDMERSLQKKLRIIFR